MGWIFGQSSKKRKPHNTFTISLFDPEKRYSKNKEYCVAYDMGYLNNRRYMPGKLVLTKGKTPLFFKQILNPDDCCVSNNGTVVCHDIEARRLLIFNNKGKKLLNIKEDSHITCRISDDNKYAIFQDRETIFIFDLDAKKVIKSFEFPSSFEDIIVDSTLKRIKFIDNRKFVYETDFEGHQLNNHEWELQIMLKGTVYDKIQLYNSTPDEIKFKDPHYLKLLQDALKMTDDLISPYSGKDTIYRLIGEYYEARGNMKKPLRIGKKPLKSILK